MESTESLRLFVEKEFGTTNTTVTKHKGIFDDEMAKQKEKN